jgi:hypothetical protein
MTATGKEATMTLPNDRPMPRSALQRFFGGSPLSVIVRLVLLSILIGFILHVLDFDPWNLLLSIERLFRALWDMGFEAVRLVWRYFVLGAVLVIPIWLIVRLIRAPKGR